MLLRDWSRESDCLNTWVEEKEKGKNHPRVSPHQKLSTLRLVAKIKRSARGNANILLPLLEENSEQTSLLRGPWREISSRCWSPIRKDGSSSMKALDRPILGFYDSEKVGGTPIEKFPLVITVMIRQFGVS